MPVFATYIYKEEQVKTMRTNLSTYHAADAFAIIFKKYRQKVYADAFRMSRSAWLASDIEQEVFLTLWLKRDSLSAIENIEAYLFLLTRNQFIGHYRKEKRELLYKEEYCRYYRQVYPPPDDPVLDKEYRRLLDEALNGLPARQKQVFVMKRDLKMKSKAVARVLGIAPETVKKHMQAAVKDLREIL